MGSPGLVFSVRYEGEYVRTRELNAAGMGWTDLLTAEDDSPRAWLAAKLLAGAAHDSIEARAVAFVTQEAAASRRSSTTPMDLMARTEPVTNPARGTARRVSVGSDQFGTERRTNVDPLPSRSRFRNQDAQCL